MTTFVDTHTHPYLIDSADPVKIVDQAINAGVKMMILPNVDHHSVGSLAALHNARPENTRIAMGLHPTEVNDDDIKAQLQFVNDYLSNNPLPVAIGEVGIDLYWDKTHADKQAQIFEAQLNLASDLNLPVIIHCREGLDQTIEVISGIERCPQLVFHSFGGSVDDVERIRRICDPMFGINGIVTFKNSQLDKTLPSIGINRTLLETDAPYLAPVPYRGRLNCPAYLVNIAARVSEIYGVTLDDVGRATTANASSVFKL